MTSAKPPMVQPAEGQYATNGGNRCRGRDVARQEPCRRVDPMGSSRTGGEMMRGLVARRRPLNARPTPMSS